MIIQLLGAIIGGILGGIMGSVLFDFTHKGTK